MLYLSPQLLPPHKFDMKDGEKLLLTNLPLDWGHLEGRSFTLNVAEIQHDSVAVGLILPFKNGVRIAQTPAGGIEIIGPVALYLGSDWPEYVTINDTPQSLAKWKYSGSGLHPG